MGVLLDTTFLIAAERRGFSASEALLEIEQFLPNEEIALSVITVMEVAHGESRADTPTRAKLRGEFLSELMMALEIYPVTPELARRAGRLDGELVKQGNKVAFADLLIGVTALDLGYSVLTGNLRHFQKIPGLRVIHYSQP